MSRSQLTIVGIVVAAVAIIVVGVLILNGNSASDSLYESITQSRTEDGAFVLGDPDAPITVVAFEDFLCPHCQDFTEATVDPFIENYVSTGKARFEYRFFPVISPTISPYAAQIAECADTVHPGSFWEAHDVLFDMGRRGLINDTAGSAVAERLNIDTSALLSCVSSASQVNVDQSLGRQLGVQSTPTIMFRFNNGRPQWPSLDGQEIRRGSIDYDTLATMVDAALSTNS
ncbi:MAG: hypothetical protein D6737_07640 [Chloroflexi bacterium]|nr:MAG: hypothetical protein CUN54_05890 [Phototrophicales bacterium]RMF80583.1 MAG: hypothetical protein D6737_07640 [Chloroflexota bacterium]